MLTPEHHRSLLQRIGQLKGSKSKAQRQEGLILVERLRELWAKKAAGLLSAQSQMTNEKEEQAPEQETEAEAELEPEPSDGADHSEWQQALREIKDQLTILQHTTGFKVGPSLTYDGLQEQVRQQLVTDNVRMENALLDTSTYERFAEELAFRRFCVFAFYQVEELLNLFYHTKYGDDIEKLRTAWSDARPKVEIDSKVKSLTQISIGSKIFAYTSSTSEGDTMQSLRQVRNMEEHRCTTVLRKYAADISKLQVQYDALGLSAKRAAAKKSGGKYEMRAEERELEGRYYALKFLVEPASNAKIVRAMLGRLYNAVKSLSKD